MGFLFDRIRRLRMIFGRQIGLKPVNCYKFCPDYFRYINLMNSMKRVLGNFVKSSDMLSHNVSLRHSGNADYQSYCTGIISIIAFLVFFVIFVFKILSVVHLQSITAFEHLTDNLESSQPIDDVMFAVTIDGLDMNTINKYFGFTVSQVTNLRPSGTNESKVRTQRSIPLLQCKIDYWQDMGIENMQAIFSKRGMSAYFCPTEPFTIQGTSDEDTYIYAKIKLSPCSPTNPQCENNASRQAFLQNYVDNNLYFTVKMMMKDTIISPTQENPVSNYIQKDVLITFSATTGTLGYIQIADYEINTDTNILPWSSYQTTQGYYVYRHQTTSVPSTKRFVDIKVDKSTKKFSVQRQYGKIDDMLSYVGGLFGLLFYCVQFVMGSYNEYRYELSVGEALFNYDDQGNQSKSDDMGFWTYVTYSIYDWFDFFGLQLSKWSSMKQIHETREQANEQMDVRHLMRKICYLENVIEVLISDEQRICLLLSQLPTLNKMQKLRKVVDYYQSRKKSEQQPQKIDQKKLGSQVELNPNPNNSKYLISHIVNQEFARSDHPGNFIKETVQNEVMSKNEDDELANEVSQALIKIMADENDPINRKILSRMKPKVKAKIQRSQTFNMRDKPVPLNNLKKQQNMRRFSK